MENNFAAGIIIGIIIGVVGVKMYAPAETPAVSSKPQTQTQTVVVPRYNNYVYDDEDHDDGWHDDFDYATYGLHERGF